MKRGITYVLLALAALAALAAGAAAQTQTQGDLAVERVDPGEPIVGAEGVAEAVIVNHGPDAVTGFTATFYWDDQGVFLTGEAESSRAGEPLNALQPGEEATVNVSWTPSVEQSGNGDVIAEVDSDGNEDPDPSNDVASTSAFVVRPGANVDPSWDQEEIPVDVGATRDFAFTVENTGNVEGVYAANVSAPEEGPAADWTFETTPEEATILPGDAATFALTVHVPDEAEAGEQAGPDQGVLLTVEQQGYRASDRGVTDVEAPRLTVDETRGLALEVPDLESGRPGETLPASNVRVENAGNTNETVDLEAAEDEALANWTIAYEPASVHLDAFNATEEPRLEVTLPEDARAGTHEVETVAVAREGSLPPVARETARVTVEQVRGVEVNATEDELSLLPQQAGTVPVEVTNTGNGPDEVTVEATAPDGWTLAPSPDVLELEPGATGLVHVEVQPPATSPPQEGVEVGLAFSTGGGEQAATREVQATVDVLEGPHLRVDAPDERVRADPDTGATVPLTVENVGNQAGDLTVEATAPEDWEATLDRRSVNDLGPGSDQDLTMTVTAPEGALTGNQAQVELEQTGDVPEGATNPLVDLVVGGPDLQVALADAPDQIQEGGVANVTVDVSSHGLVAAPETSLVLEAEGSRGVSTVTSWTVPELAPGENASFSAAWDTTGWEGPVVLRANANPDREVREEDPGSSEDALETFVAIVEARLTAPPPRSVDPGQSVTQGLGPNGLRVANVGNVDQDATVRLVDEAGWIEQTHQLSLPAGAEEGLGVSFQVPRPTGSVENTVALEVELADAPDRSWNETWRLTVRDVAPPRVVDVLGAQDLEWGQQATLEVAWDDGTGIAAGTATVHPPGAAPSEHPLTVDDGTVTFGWQPEHAGMHELVVELTDLADNTAQSGRVEVSVDPPAAPKIETPGPVTTAPGQPLALSINATAPLTVVRATATPTDAGEANATGPSVDQELVPPYEVNTTGWSPGTHEVLVEAVDETGQRATAAFNVTVTTKTPEIASAAIDPPDPEPGDQATVELGFDRPVSEVTLVLVREDGTRATHNTTLPDAEEASLSFRVTEPIERIDVEATSAAGVTGFHEDAVPLGGGLMGVPGPGVVVAALALATAGLARGARARA